MVNLIWYITHFFGGIFAGRNNTITDQSNNSSDFSIIGGGENNTLYGDSCSILGGSGNLVTGKHFISQGNQSKYSSILAGVENTTSGTLITILGGSGNFCSGPTSFIMGNNITSEVRGGSVLADDRSDPKSLKKEVYYWILKAELI